MAEPIQIELKSIKVDQRLSQETHAYSAKLFVDGRHVADVGNDGGGGADRYLGPGKGLDYGVAMRAYDEASRRVAAELPKQNLASDGEPENLVEDSLEFLCARLVTQHLIEKDVTRDLKRHVMFFKDGLPSEGARAPLFQYRLQGDVQRIVDHIITKHPGAYVLNGRPMDEAIAAYMRSE